MFQTAFLLAMTLALQVHLTSSWSFMSQDTKIKIKPDDWDTEENKRIYEENCGKLLLWLLCKINTAIKNILDTSFDFFKSVCGRDETHNFKPWSVFILALLKKTDKRRLNHMRRCVGTLINSNMVVTSHKCLVQQLNQTINIYNAWINNFTLPLDRFFVTRNILIQNDLFPVKDIILNTRYAYNEVKEIFPGSDMAILVLKDTNVLQKMIPICLPEYKRDINVLYQIGYFYGVGGVYENDITEETRTANGVPILSGPECDDEQGGVHYHLKASLESFCIRYPTLAPVGFQIIRSLIHH